MPSEKLPPDNPVEGEITQYGFRWGPLTVERTAEIQGRVAITVKTEFHTMTVYSSVTGRSLRVFENGKELKCR